MKELLNCYRMFHQPFKIGQSATPAPSHKAAGIFHGCFIKWLILFPKWKTTALSYKNMTLRLSETYPLMQCLASFLLISYAEWKQTLKKGKTKPKGFNGFDYSPFCRAVFILLSTLQ